MPKKPAIFPRPRQRAFLDDITTAPDLQSVIDIMVALRDTFPARRPEQGARWTWVVAFNLLINYLIVLAGEFAGTIERGTRFVVGTPATIFAEGNGKLPFSQFSTLPLYTCPGKGACAVWCYSLKAWRAPTAFIRQVQNYLLMKYDRAAIRREFLALPHGVFFRLYVDGDFADMGELAFWFGLLNSRPDIKCYGYSKSLHLFRQWAEQGLPFPKNYRLNLSGGGKFEPGNDIYEQCKTLPVYRGEFMAVTVTGKYAEDQYSDARYHADVRAAVVETTGEKGVSCGGLCGQCGVNAGGHWCWNDRYHGVVIGIGIH